MPYPSGVGGVDCANALATVQAANTNLSRGGHHANPGTLSVLNRSFGGAERDAE